MVEALELAVRIGAGLLVIFAPTLVFMGLWRGLDRLRDDELIERARRQARTSPSAAASPAPADLIPETTEEQTVACERCGTPNRATARFCRECLGRLPEE